VRVHHLNCSTLCPSLGPLRKRLVNERGELVCHCLLVETNDGLVLVDTGFSEADLLEPSRIHGALRGMVVADPELSAIRQVRRLGFRAEDVRHIVLTHLDVDHAGGLCDFPEAKVHVYAREHRAAMERASFYERLRYVPSQWAHAPRWVLHDVTGEHWEGFEAVKDIPGLPPEILIVPLTGHTRGHCGVAISAGDGWLFHCGDAYFHHSDVTPDGKGTLGLNLFQGLMAIDDATRRLNQRRLRALAAHGSGRIRMFCAHDPIEFAAFVA
jgi:glyoxylase-like metal-dependent hydrolase (beta-lactamase superfamily II)